MKKHSKWLFLPFLALALFFLFLEKPILSTLILNIVTVYFASVYGSKISLIGLLVFSIAGSLICNSEWAIWVMLHAIPALVMGLCLFHKTKFSTILISSSLAQVAVLAIHTKEITDKLGLKTVQWLFGPVIEEMKSMLLSEEFSQIGFGMDAAVVLNTVSGLLQTMLPCFYILSAVFLVYILLSFVRFLLEKRHDQFNYLPKFYELSMPRHITTVFILLFIISFFTDSPILSNVISVMFTIHIICGLSLLDFIFVKKNMPKVIRIAVLGAILSISTALGGLTTSLLCCFGMNDSVRTVRK